MTPLTALYAPVAEELRQMEQILRREMRSRYPYVDELVRYAVGVEQSRKEKRRYRSVTEIVHRRRASFFPYIVVYLNSKNQLQ